MDYVFEERASASPLIEKLWRTRSEEAVSFLSSATANSEIVVMKHQDQTSITVRGPESQASAAQGPAGAEFFGIVFCLGTFMPELPPAQLRDCNEVTLPDATGDSFWLKGATWELPSFENADTFVEHLAHQDLLVHDPVVDAALRGQPLELTPRAVQYHFVRATGLTHKAIRQIERAQKAMLLLQQGRPILDTVFEAGYYDQPHLTRALKRYTGQTPAQFAGVGQAE